MKSMTNVMFAGLLAFAMTTTDAAAAGRVAVHGTHRNAAGGVTSGHASAWRGANATGLHGHGFAADGQGNAVAARGSAVVGANGARYARGARTSYGADGSIRHDAGFDAVGPNGASASSRGHFTRNADGTYSGARSTSAQRADGARYEGSTAYGNGSGTHTTDLTAANGDTYEGETSWTRGDGITHSGTCRDAAGSAIPCP